MKAVVSIVEGDGEVSALPVLLRRIGQWLSPEEHIHVNRPIRVRRDQFLNREEIFQKQLRLAALQCSQPEFQSAWILIVLDADDDCPAELAQAILARATQIIPHHRVSVVLANREFEAWFIAASASIHGSRGFSVALGERPDAESVRGAKEWLKERMTNRRYSEIIDQPAFSALIDLEQARANSRSFRKLCSEWQKNMGPLNGYARP
jgi:hypothetical protein